ncbi:GLPGLI family protein [Pedobacter sp. GR22-6]|uniref:GLPGLI family protein n=1 Tax=Pedobacter sp. GR22-6 TaxID=3127957 RepID=UPI00307D8669
MIKQLMIGMFLCLCCLAKIRAQQLFIPNGKISFEKKVNVQRSMEGWDIPDEAKEKMQKYNLSTWELFFNSSISSYKQQKKETENTDNMFGFNMQNNNELYADYAASRRILKKNFFNDTYLLNDSIPKVNWKIMHDVREIAGYECRKAIGRINDTVYVVAFYTDEILLRGGPEGFSGLPGMILGLAIPRYNTTWFATKVEAFSIADTDLKPPSAKKTDTDRELKKIMEIYSRFDGNQKQKPEEVRKQIYGFLL